MGKHNGKMDSFHVLPEVEYKTAMMLYQTGKLLGCKIVFKTRALKNQPKGYRVTFNKMKNNKALFWMEMSGNSLLVKANLLHIDEYTEKISSCSDRIKKQITDTKECENCHPHCGSLHLSHHIDNVKYTPCYFKGHYFSQMGEEDWNLLKELIVLENTTV